MSPQPCETPTGGSPSSWYTTPSITTPPAALGLDPSENVCSSGNWSRVGLLRSYAADSGAQPRGE
jgi:hypothetical protein